MRSAEFAAEVSPVFARHETFHPRYGWLRKAYVAALAGPDVFTKPDATVQLGVGKNMVHAIRYWGLAFKVLGEQPNPDRPRLSDLVPTEFGNALLGEGGWDPFVEDPASLWLLHWQLLRPPCLAPAWWATFHAFPPRQFDDGALFDTLSDLVSSIERWPVIVPGSLKKDVDCVIRMYAARSSGRQTLDDIIDCPFRDLGLVEPVPGERGHRFVVGAKQGLADAMVGYACLDFAHRVARGARSISLARLTTDAGSPGRLADLHPGVRVADPAGLRQLYLADSPDALSHEVLSAHYGAQSLTRPDHVPEGSSPSADDLVAVT
jgi:hypothetical protein